MPRAAAAGLVLVASAGNYGTLDGAGDTVMYPAHYSSVIAVGATMNLDDQRALFCGTGPDLDLMAPGVGIYTTDLFGQYVYESGTSIATPHVTGVAALLIRNGVSDVYSTLLSTAIDMGPAGFDSLYGYGLVNAAAAVAIPARPHWGWPCWASRSSAGDAGVKHGFVVARFLWFLSRDSRSTGLAQWAACNSLRVVFPVGLPSTDLDCTTKSRDDRANLNGLRPPPRLTTHGLTCRVVFGHILTPWMRPTASMVISP